MVEIGDVDCHTNGAKSDSWFKFFVIKQQRSAGSTFNSEIQKTELASKKVKFIKKKAFPANISQL